MTGHQSVATIRRPPLLLAATALVLSSCLSNVSSFPIVAEVDDDDGMCFRFNMPDKDDAHFAFIALPQDVEDEVEDWFVNAFSEMTRYGSDMFMKKLPDLPPKIQGLAKQGHVRTSNLWLKVQKPRRPILKREMFEYYIPIIMRNVVQMDSEGNRGWDPNAGEYIVCFENDSRNPARVLYDFVLLSDKLETEMRKKHQLLKKEHLTPLERSFEASIVAARTILDEMHYMERREARMKTTADSTNTRIRYFSYMSVSILLGVTWLQVMYLKSYFRKKKIL